MTTITATEAKKNFDTIASRVVSDAEPLVITLESGAQIVLMPLDDFSAWQETAYLLSNPANAAHLRKSLHEAQDGKFVFHELLET